MRTLSGGVAGCTGADPAAATCVRSRSEKPLTKAKATTPLKTSAAAMSVLRESRFGLGATARIDVTGRTKAFCSGVRGGSFAATPSLLFALICVSVRCARARG